MPKVSFYLRNEDLETWKSITKKTEWVHNRLDDERDYQKYANIPTPKGTITLSKTYDAFVKPDAVYTTKPRPQVITLIDKETFDKAGPIKLCKKHGLPVLSGRTICGMKDCK